MVATVADAGLLCGQTLVVSLPTVWPMQHLKYPGGYVGVLKISMDGGHNLHCNSSTRDWVEAYYWYLFP